MSEWLWRRIASRWQPGFAKYGAVGVTTVRNQLAYGIDLCVRSLFLIVILYIFVQLWRVTFHGVGTERIAGYRFEDIIWYLIFSESIIMGTPRLTNAVEEDVKSGGIAYLLTHPMSYVLYHYANFMGEGLVRLVINMAMGGALGLALFGPPDFGLGGWLGFWPVAIGGFTVNFTIRMSLALAAFWVEETQGLTFVYDKLLFTIGGMMLPIELFPDSLRRLCEWLPFQTIVYFPAKTMVQFDPARLVTMLGAQLGWTLALGALLACVYRKGVRKLNVNGG